MAFVVEDMHDLLVLLRQQPAWADELRTILVGQEILSLPTIVRELARTTAEQVAAWNARQDQLDRGHEEQKSGQVELRTEVHELRHDVAGLRTGQDLLRSDMTELRAGQDELRRDVAELHTGQRELRRDVTGLRQDIGEVRSAVGDLNTRVNNLDGRVGNLEGNALENRYTMHIPARFGTRLRGAKQVDPFEFPGVDEALATARISEADLENLANSDLVVSGRSRQDGEPLYFVVELSTRINLEDVERADERARVLTRAGHRARGFVAGFSASDAALIRARLAGVEVALHRHRGGTSQDEESA